MHDTLKMRHDLEEFKGPIGRRTIATYGVTALKQQRIRLCRVARERCDRITSWQRYDFWAVIPDITIARKTAICGKPKLLAFGATRDPRRANCHVNPLLFKEVLHKSNGLIAVRLVDGQLKSMQTASQRPSVAKACSNQVEP
jgi:hypothetical protein